MKLNEETPIYEDLGKTKDIIKARLYSILSMATPEEVYEGCWWYNKAYAECVKISKSVYIETGELYSKQTVAEVIAILSPRNKWERNLIDAKNLLLHKDKAVIATFNANKQKALRLINGEEVKLSRKVKAFASAILDTGLCKEPFGENVVDVWMLRAAGLKANNKNYTIIDRVLDEIVVEFVGIDSNRLQAIIWVVTRRLYKNKEDLIPSCKLIAQLFMKIYTCGLSCIAIKFTLPQLSEAYSKHLVSLGYDPSTSIAPRTPEYIPLRNGLVLGFLRIAIPSAIIEYKYNQSKNRGLIWKIQ